MSTADAASIREASWRHSAADHAGTIRGHYPFWDVRYRPFLIRAVEAFPDEHLHFKPRPELLTAHQMILHIAEAERGWIHSVVDGHADEEWVAPHEDPAQGWVTTVPAEGKAALLERLEAWHRPTQRWLDRSAWELSRECSRTRPDGVVQRFTLHFVLDHVQEHEIHHRGQLNLYLRLLGIEPPSI